MDLSNIVNEYERMHSDPLEAIAKRLNNLATSAMSASMKFHAKGNNEAAEFNEGKAVAFMEAVSLLFKSVEYVDDEYVLVVPEEA